MTWKESSMHHQDEKSSNGCQFSERGAMGKATLTIQLSKKRQKTKSATQTASCIAQTLVLFICFLMTTTLLDVDAPEDHGDLHDIVVVPRTSGAPNKASEKKETGANTIAYAVTITSCATEEEATFQIAEGAAVLAHSIRTAHAKSNFEYNYQMYAIYHPEAKQCADLLKPMNYTLVPRETPIVVKDIKGKFLREKIEENGCCGEKELIKLEAFTLTDHPVVVLLDLDTLVLKPLDRLFDFLMKGRAMPRDELQWPERSNAPDWKDVKLLYTLDYAMVPAKRKIKPAQGGFLVMRPDMKVYEDLRQVVLEGDFRKHGGWGGVSLKFWGAMTIQGLMPYYFTILKEEKHSIELNRWIYDNMCSPSREKNPEDNDKRTGTCFTGESTCESCGDRPINDVHLIHFTVCQKPWLCMRPRERNLCDDFHRVWFQARSDMEKEWGRSGFGPGTDKYREHSHGYCSDYGTKGYTRISKPYGRAIGP